MSCRTLVWGTLVLAGFGFQTLQAQQETPSDPAALQESNPTFPAPQAPKPNPIRILYTGKSFGYFRVPDWQTAKGNDKSCNVANKDGAQSTGAADFEQLLREKHAKDAILVGTGDNFAPELGARDFCSPPTNQVGVPSQRVKVPPAHQRVGKEFFSWDTGSQRWVTNEQVALEEKQDKEKQKRKASTNPNPLWKRLQNGEGTIPFDNVANFFIQEGYAALVPGKHDFHFGPERLRELARYLANTPIPEHNLIHDRSVQMLGANLVIETTWKADHKPLPDRELPPWFIPRFPTAIDLIGSTDVEMKLSGLSDGGSVYPWFVGPTLQFSKGDVPDRLVTQLGSSTLYLCEATQLRQNGSRDPNAIPEPATDAQCHSVTTSPPLGSKTQQYQILFPWKDTRIPVLTPGQNYGLCIVAPQNIQVSDSKGGHTFCVRFSVYVPFFQYPWDKTAKACRDPADHDCNPEPFVVLERKDHPQLAKDVAIFGVVDPALAQQAGILNFAWSNSNDNYKTQTAVKDPAEALREMLAFFERKYSQEHDKQQFVGIKVLLAQLSPEQAQVLATRVGKFQVVVSAADEQMATVKDASTTEWNVPPRATAQYPRFLAVPEPFYVSKRDDPTESHWIVDVGSLTIRLPGVRQGKWILASDHLRKSSDLLSTEQAPKFWASVEQKVLNDCVPSGFSEPLQGDRTNQIQLLTLCAMQQHEEADIALLQERDFFPDLPKLAGDIGDRTAGQDLLRQQIIDRIIWKGDFLQLLYVPGVALKKAFDQAKAFDADDRSLLSLSTEKQRGLVWLGVTFDSERSEYVINGVPLDSNKLYSVATTDFIGAGDTGYPDLAASQVNPPLVPGDFGKRLTTISSIVCRYLAGEAEADTDCLDPLVSDDYLDELATSPADTRPGAAPLAQLRRWSIFDNPPGVPGDPSKLKPTPPDSTQGAAQQAVEQRRLWDFNLIKWTMGITTVGHSGTDFDVQNNFSGIATPGISAFRSTTWTSDLQAQWTRSWQYNQIFASPAYNYNTQYKGQPDDLRQINQVADLGMFDLGFVHLWNGRGAEHYDSVLSAYFETPLTKTFTAFSLATSHAGAHSEQIKDQIRFNLDRSYTEFVRAGFRWKRRVSFIEVGPEWGHEWNALQGIDFNTDGNKTSCSAKADVPISQCVKNAIKANPQAITSTSLIATQRIGQNHSGMYWRINLTVPFHPRVSYVLTDTGDWFFTHYRSENSTTTLLRDYSQHQLKFTIFPSFSIGPEFDLLLYKNKAAGTLQGHFLRQNQVIMKAQFSFDWFNRRHVMKQIEYAPSANSK